MYNYVLYIYSCYKIYEYYNYFNYALSAGKGLKYIVNTFQSPEKKKKTKEFTDWILVQDIDI